MAEIPHLRCYIGHSLGWVDHNFQTESDSSVPSSIFELDRTADSPVQSKFRAVPNCWDTALHNQSPGLT